MNIKNRSVYYLLILAFPVFFILHGINENFSLIGVNALVRLTVYYCAVSLAIATVALLIIKDLTRAFVFSFFGLLVFFFFGLLKDVTGQLISYKILLPVIGTGLFTALVYFRRSRLPFRRTAVFISVLLLVYLTVETGHLIYNNLSGKSAAQDFGDHSHQLISAVKPASEKPVIFWVVFDEYSGQQGLLKGWGFNNPIDSVLRQKGFFVADSATSNYNYTHYSLASMLDMQYLGALKNHTELDFRDIMRAHYSLSSNNTIELLKKNGYEIENYSIYDIDDYPTKGLKDFPNGEFELVDNQTLPGRVKRDIGWNAHTLFSKNKKQADSLLEINSLKEMAASRTRLLQQTMKAADARKRDSVPVFFMFHYMFTHEAFLYDDNGELSLHSGYGMAPHKYVASVKYANRVIEQMVDSIKQMYAGKELVIIIQGDHGYKFEEKDPLFETESCSMLYAVYCSDGDYSLWKNKLSAVNSFRILFNKYFATGFPMLADSCYNLYYRQ